MHLKPVLSSISLSIQQYLHISILMIPESMSFILVPLRVPWSCILCKEMPYILKSEEKFLNWWFFFQTNIFCYWFIRSFCFLIVYFTNTKERGNSHRKMKSPDERHTQTHWSLIETFRRSQMSFLIRRE